MLVTAMVGMTTKFVEVTLSHKYREKISDGTMSGGPMYFMKNADFRLFGNKINLKWVGILFAFATVLSSFGTGSLPQINSIASGLESTFNLDPLITASVLSVLLALVIIVIHQYVMTLISALAPVIAVRFSTAATVTVFIKCMENSQNFSEDKLNDVM